MRFAFHKYHGTGNDFILIDNRTMLITLTKEQIAFLCHRNFGIGADGLMLLEPVEVADFKMVYFNSDGQESTMCGNGGRCLVRFAAELGLIAHNTSFLAIDGMHEASLEANGMVNLGMKDVIKINRFSDHLEIDTGSPHYIKWVENLDESDVYSSGKQIRNEDKFQPGGINVNFVERLGNGIKVRTYERGVENETLSCGTGVTAAAIASVEGQVGEFSIPVFTPGGRLEVSFEKPDTDSAIDVILKGPAVMVFSGVMEL
jgi:diaminopimelate epimerase